jgi:signal transduction histidine kinase
VTFPPPFRFLVPLLLLVLGLIASWLDYELNLANDLERNFNDVTAQAEVTGTRLAALVQQHLARGEIEALRESLSAWNNEPWLRMAAVVNDAGVILAGSEPGWEGRSARESPVAPAWERARQRDTKVLESMTTNGGDTVVGAFPIAAGGHATHWLLEVFDRAATLAQAHLDARRQLAWTASVMAFFCLCLWAVLHFGVAVRLERLARSARDFGEGRATRIETVGGGDEVHELSEAFAAMSGRLADRESERRDLERKVIDSAENERRRIGHELHDGIGQQLTSALMAMKGLHDELRTEAPASADKSQNLSRQLRDTIDEVRGLSHGLAPVPLWERGLEHALQALADSTARSSGVRCVFECPEPVTVNDEATAGNLYRIAQEAVNNALKHAAPGEIRIGLEQHRDTIVLEVDDDGGGLPETLPGGGMGFRVMRHRAEMMGGRLEYGAAPAGGARIAVHIPAAR